MNGEKRQPTLADERLSPRHLGMRAYFSTRGQADRASRAVANYVRTVWVADVPPPPQAGEKIISFLPAQFPNPGWLALPAGALIGLAFAVLAYASRGGLPGLSVASSSRLVAVSFLVTGLSAVAGWLGAAVVRLFKKLGRSTGYELQAIVVPHSLDEAERSLRNSGALTVWVLGDEGNPMPEFD